MTKPRRDEPNEITEMWRDVRHMQQERRASRRTANTAAIERLRVDGYQVTALTEFQFRIDGMLDLYPTHRRYHYLPLDKRGTYDTPITIARRFLTARKPTV